MPTKLKKTYPKPKAILPENERIIIDEQTEIKVTKKRISTVKKLLKLQK